MEQPIRSAVAGNILSICLCLAALLTGAGRLQAQGIFNQNGSQTKLQIQQIAALKAYAGYLEKGYKVVRDGTKLIGDAKNGEFNLHKDYFGSLKTVNPAVSGDDKVDAIRQMGEAIPRLRAQALQEATASLLFSDEELAGFRRLLAGLGEQAVKDREELELVITSGMLALTDDERLARINHLYESISGTYATQRRWNKTIHLMVGTRNRTSKDLQLLRELYGL